MANASIFSQFVKPVRSLQDYANDYDAAEQNQLALAAKRMDMQKAQRGMQDRDRIRGLASQYGGDENALIKALRGGGYFEQAGGIEKQIAERLKAEEERKSAGVTRAKTEQEIQSKKLEDAKRRIDLAGQAFGFVKDNPSTENAIRAADFLKQNGVWDAETVQVAIARVQENPTPEAVRALATQAFQSALDAKEQLPKYFSQSRGGTAAIVGVNPVTGAATDAQTAQVTQTPDSLASNAQRELTRAQQQRQYEETKRFEREKFGYQKQKDAEKPAPGTAPAKPMPAAAMRMQDDDLNAIGTFAGIDKDLEGIQKQIETGKLNLGLVGNVTGDVRNRVGMSNENSRNLATFKAKLENMRNSVLLLNKGVQTEGDAQRAMNEMIANINDPDVVKQRLKEIRALNQRAVQLKKNNLDMLRRNYGQEDMDYSKYENQPPATNLPNGNALSPEDAQALEWANKNPNDPRSKAIKQRIGGG